MLVGATTDRPTNVTGVLNVPQKEMFDLTLGKPIFLVGNNPPSFVDITGAAV
jgi:hypothetical protein